MYPSRLGVCGDNQGRPHSDTFTHNVAGDVSSRPSPGVSDVGSRRLYDGRRDNDVRKRNYVRLYMGRQIVLENDQLVKIVNESAKRVLRGLMSEGFLGSALANTANVLKIASMLPMVPSIMNGVEKMMGGDNGAPQNSSPYQGSPSPSYGADRPTSPLGNGQSEGKPQQVSAEDLIKLYQTNPEAFQAIVQNPSLLNQMGGSSDTMSQLANDPSLMQQLASDPKLQALLQLM